MKKCPQCGIVQSGIVQSGIDECQICGMIFEESKPRNEIKKPKTSKKNTYILALSVVLALGSLLAIYFFVISPHLINRQKHIEAYESLKRIEAYLESGVSFIEHRKLIKEANFKLNLIKRNSSRKKKLIRVYEIYNNIGDLSYYCQTGSYSVPKCDEALIISTKLVKSLSETFEYKEYYEYHNKINEKWASGVYLITLRFEDRSKKYSEKARPILFTTANQLLKECEP